MPYSSPPAKTRKLPDKKRRQWMHVFNSSMKAGDDEVTAHKKAWGTVKQSSWLNNSGYQLGLFIKYANELGVSAPVVINNTSNSTVQQPNTNDSTGPNASAMADNTTAYEEFESEDKEFKLGDMDFSNKKKNSGGSKQPGIKPKFVNPYLTHIMRYRQ